MSDILHVVVVNPIAYLALVAFLRISGKRTLTKLNAFDLVVTVALGSVLATVALNHSVSLGQGLAAMAMLIGLQYVITWCSVRQPWLEGLVKSEPTLLIYKGSFIDRALVVQRVTRDEVAAVLRSRGIAEIANVDAVVLETDGSFGVVESVDWSNPSTLKGIDLSAVPVSTRPAEPSRTAPVAPV
ncbi:DUF421 domain-containing protein [Rhodopseudomonas sp. B29]|uniref:DUF421 domain-containing protein n=1 Tax=Rhodopseudomonas sp. B29 TaxID=95607 RepID=UPI0003B3E9E9|nr:YetF domain-containing protein [Rhodopseudomonas sp. B29]